MLARKATFPARLQLANWHAPGIAAALIEESCGYFDAIRHTERGRRRRNEHDQRQHLQRAVAEKIEQHVGEGIHN